MATSRPPLPDTSRPTGESAARPRRGFGARDIAYIATFTALIVVLGVPGAIYAFGSGVPITLQTMGIMLAALVLGPKRGAAASLLFLALCAVGLPVLAGGRGGLSYLVGPSIGYFLGYAFGAYVIGWFVTRRARFSVPMALAGAILGGIVLIHAFGVAGLMWRAGMTFDKALMTDLVFVPGDLVKAVLAVVIAAAVHRAIPGLLPARDGSRR